MRDNKIESGLWHLGIQYPSTKGCCVSESIGKFVILLRLPLSGLQVVVTVINKLLSFLAIVSNSGSAGAMRSSLHTERTRYKMSQ